MNTGDLINALVEDQSVVPGRSAVTSAVLIAAGLSFSLLVFFIFLGVRTDFAQAMHDPHVLFKFVFAASLSGSFLPLVMASFRPDMKAKPIGFYLLLPAFVLSCGIAFQLLTSPSEFWVSGMKGRYPLACLRNIPVLALGPLVVLMLFLRNGAPTRPILSGALAGLVAGGMAAFIYALHCPDDSALFVAVWYLLAIGIVTGIGAMLGARILRW